MLRQAVLMSFCFFIMGCPSKKSSESVKTGPVVQLQVPPQALVKTSENQDLQILMQMLSDLDAIYRELIRIALEQKETDLSLFYKLQRAVATEAGVKISPQARLGCERYSLRFQPDKKNWQSLDVLETCLKDPVVLMSVQKKAPEQFQLKFYSEPLQRLLGLKATLAFSEAQCSLTAQSGRLNQFSCERLAQEKPNTQWVLLLQSMTGKQADKNFQAQLQGQLLENLAPLRKFEMIVPQEGPVKITETELFPAENEPAPVVPAPVKPAPVPAQAPLVAPVPESPTEGYQKWISGEPVNPGGQIPGQQQEAPAEETAAEDEASDEADPENAETASAEEDEASSEDMQSEEEVAPQSGGVIGAPELPGPEEIKKGR